jgi:hypothetical protein
VSQFFSSKLLILRQKWLNLSHLPFWSSAARRLFPSRFPAPRGGLNSPGFRRPSRGTAKRASELVELGGVAKCFHGVAVALEQHGLELRQGLGAVLRTPSGTVLVDGGLELAGVG